MNVARDGAAPCDDRTVHAILPAMRRSPPGWLLTALVTCASSAALSVLVPCDARADDPAATALIERGLDLRQAQRDAEALALFEAAQRLAPSPRGQAQVALAQQALGRWGLAELNLRAALAAKGDTWIESRRPILERALGVITTHLGDVEIVGAKGTVFIDGARVDGPDALTHLRLEVGRRMFELRAEGSYPFSRVLDVLPGEVVRIEVEQHPLLAESPSADVNPAPGTSRAVTPPAEASNAGHTQRLLGWIALGGAGLFLGTGVAGLVDRSTAASNFNGSAACTSQPSNALSSQCRGWLDDGSTGSTIAIVGFVGSGLVGALSLALLITAPSSHPKTAAFSLPCSPSKGGASWLIEGTF